MIDYLPFIIFLMILALFLRAESALTVLYMVLGTFLLGIWWNRRALQHIEISRDFSDHVFLGEEIPVVYEIHNKSLLPILWLEVHESLPANLRAGRTVKHVFSLGIRDKKKFTYQLHAFKRGYYALGPTTIRSGDPLGLVQPGQKELPGSSLTVYPQIVQLDTLGIPSRSPFGTIKHHDPIFEDPSRMMGKRDFQYGDSIRRIDWKSTASSGKLQVKLYEASIDMEVTILLDLNRESYDIKTFYPATELSVTAAASIAAWGERHDQAIGLHTNGSDPIKTGTMPNPIQPKKGAGHFINILEILARIEPGDVLPVDHLVQSAFPHLTWGASIILISGGLQPSTLDLLNQARKRGVHPVVILTSHAKENKHLQKQAEHYKIKFYVASDPGEFRKQVLV